MTIKPYPLSYMAILEKPELEVELRFMPWYGISDNTDPISLHRRSNPELWHNVHFVSLSKLQGHSFLIKSQILTVTSWTTNPTSSLDMEAVYYLCQRD